MQVSKLGSMIRLIMNVLTHQPLVQPQNMGLHELLQPAISVHLNVFWKIVFVAFIKVSALGLLWFTYEGCP